MMGQVYYLPELFILVAMPMDLQMWLQHYSQNFGFRDLFGVLVLTFDNLVFMQKISITTCSCAFYLLFLHLVHSTFSALWKISIL
jgi:hypothetical protein